MLENPNIRTKSKFLAALPTTEAREREREIHSEGGGGEGGTK